MVSTRGCAEPGPGMEPRGGISESGHPSGRRSPGILGRGWCKPGAGSGQAARAARAGLRGARSSCQGRAPRAREPREAVGATSGPGRRARRSVGTRASLPGPPRPARATRAPPRGWRAGSAPRPASSPPLGRPGLGTRMDSGGAERRPGAAARDIWGRGIYPAQAAGTVDGPASSRSCRVLSAPGDPRVGTVSSELSQPGHALRGSGGEDLRGRCRPPLAVPAEALPGRNRGTKTGRGLGTAISGLRACQVPVGVLGAQLG